MATDLVRARTGGRCPCCPEPIRKGQKVYLIGGRVRVHAGCFGAAALCPACRRPLDDARELVAGVELHAACAAARRALEPVQRRPERSRPMRR